MSSLHWITAAVLLTQGFILFAISAQGMSQQTELDNLTAVVKKGTTEVVALIAALREQIAAGGHPVEPTSDMLRDAAAEIQNLAAMAYSTRQPWIEGFAAELRDRAAQMAAHGD